MRVMLLFFICLTMIGVRPVSAQTDLGRFVEFPAVPSANIAAPHVVVWLPPGYDAARRRYGVVYMHDGQNLFFPARSNFNKVWAADKSALRLITAKKVPPFIIVGIDQPGKDRGRQYLPNRMYQTVSPETRNGLDAFIGGPVISDAYLRFLVKELKPKIDREFRTIADRRHTAIAGSSMGGLISFYAITQYPDIFGVAGCVSTHWPLASPGDLSDPNADVVASWTRYVKNDLGAPKRRRIWFDHGDATLDAYYAPYQKTVDQALQDKGWLLQRDFASRNYAGAAHEENAWAARLDAVFEWMLAGWK